jgi:hypothetical protein
MQEMTMRHEMMKTTTARPTLLAAAATVAIGLALVTGVEAQAQQGQQAVTTSQPQAPQQPVQRAAQELRVAHQQLGDASGPASPQAVQRVRQALDQMSQAVGQAPQDQRGQVEQRVVQAREVLQGENVPAPRLRTAIEQVLSAVPSADQAGQRSGVTPARQGGSTGTSQAMVPQGDQQAPNQQGMAAQTDPAAARTGAPAAAQPAQSGGQAAQPAASRGAGGGLSLERASTVVGTNVVGANGRDAGEIENLLIDGNGQVRAAVVEWGGFLGIGTRRAVVPIEQLTFSGPSDRVQMDLTRPQLEALPRYETARIEEYGRMGGWAEGVRAYR